MFPRSHRRARCSQRGSAEPEAGRSEPGLGLIHKTAVSPRGPRTAGSGAARVVLLISFILALAVVTPRVEKLVGGTVFLLIYSFN